jgi:predicted ferric reductase
MKIYWQRYLWLSVYFLTPLIPVMIILKKRTVEATDPRYVISMMLGVFAFMWLVNQIILSSRPRFLERYFGMDRLYRFHSLMAVISVLLAFTHFIIKRFLFGIISITGFIALMVFIFGGLFSLIFLEDSVLLRIRGVMAFRAWVRKTFHLSRVGVVLLHNILILALITLLVHIMTTSGSLYASPFLKIFYPTYFGMGILFYLYHKFIKPMLLRKNFWRVKEVTPESPGITTIHIQPEDGRVFAYQPGQFIFLTLLQQGLEKEPHPFSLSSSPERKDMISITIKNAGDFTSKIDQLQPGAIALVEGPFGIFSYTHLRSGCELVFLAGGIGITPFLSMLRTLQRCEPQRKVTLIWAARLKSDLFAAQELDAMYASMPDFHWEGVLSEEVEWEGEKGLLDYDHLERLIGKPLSAKEIEIFLCGPPRMMNLCLHGLKKLGYRRNQIHYERFAL